MDQNVTKEKQYEHGQIIVMEREFLTGSYRILTGRAKCCYTNDNGKLVSQILLLPGDIYGFRRALGRYPGPYRVVAVGPTTLEFIGREVILNTFGISKEDAEKLVNMFTIELRSFERHTSSLLNHSTRQKTAKLLLVLSDDWGEGVPSPVAKMRRIEMAQLIDTTPESLSRALSAFSEENLIKSTRTNIVVVEREKLAEIVKGS